MAPTITVGGVALQSQGAMMLVGFALAMWIADDFARRRGIAQEQVANAGSLGLLASLLGARLLFALEHAEQYAGDPLALLSPTLQGMAWTEGILLAAVVVWVYLQRRAVDWLALADALLPAVAAFWATAAFGAFLSGDAYGQPSTVPWAIFLWGEMRHPVQLYETIAGGAVLLALGALWPRAPYVGWVAAVGTALLGGARLLVEGFRGDPALLGGVRAMQVAALLVTLGALWLLWRTQRRLERAAA